MDNIKSLENLTKDKESFYNELAKVIIGQKNVIEHIFIAILCKGHILLEGVPGLGKTLIIKWQDNTEHVVSSFNIRFSCPCAHCVDEITGEKLIRENDIPANVKILESSPIGRYGVRFSFDDPSPGAGAGIYTFSFLRKLGEEAATNASFDV